MEGAGAGEVDDVGAVDDRDGRAARHLLKTGRVGEDGFVAIDQIAGIAAVFLLEVDEQRGGLAARDRQGLLHRSRLRLATRPE